MVKSSEEEITGSSVFSTICFIMVLLASVIGIWLVQPANPPNSGYIMPWVLSVLFLTFFATSDRSSFGMFGRAMLLLASVVFYVMALFFAADPSTLGG